MAESTSERVLEIQEKLLALSKKRTQMSATRSYMNAERTLSVWVRTALSTMIFGIAIDRFGLMLRGLSQHPNTIFGHPSTPTTLIGAGLILFSVLMAFSAGWRFVVYTKRYRKDFDLPYHYRVWLPATYAFMVVFFGIALLFILWVIS